MRNRLYILALFAIAVSSITPLSTKAKEARHLSNQAPRDGFGSLHQLHLVEPMQIGGVGASEEPIVFGTVSSVVTDSRGYIYVADYGFEKVQVFTDEGRWVRSFGQIGEGPGDLPKYFVMTIDAKDHLYFAGMGGLVSVVDTLGRSIDLFRRTNVTSPARSIAVDEEDSVYISSTDVFHQTVIQKYDPRHRLVASFGTTFAVGWDVDTRTEELFGGGNLCLRSDGAVIYSQLAPFELRWYSRDGTLVSSFSGYRDFVPMPRDPEFGDGWMKAEAIPSSGPVVCLDNGWTLNSAYDPGGSGAEATSLLSLHDAALQPMAELRRAGLVYAVGHDHEDRVFLFERGSDIRLLRVRIEID